MKKILSPAIEALQESDNPEDALNDLIQNIEVPSDSEI
jgi:hypothetical protein